jgi:hypothetical protein
MVKLCFRIGGVPHTFPTLPGAFFGKTKKGRSKIGAVFILRRSSGNNFAWKVFFRMKLVFFENSVRMGVPTLSRKLQRIETDISKFFGKEISLSPFGERDFRIHLIF